LKTILLPRRRGCPTERVLAKGGCHDGHCPPAITERSFRQTILGLAAGQSIKLILADPNE
jgi:hypothetical protein